MIVKGDVALVIPPGALPSDAARIAVDDNVPLTAPQPPDGVVNGLFSLDLRNASGQSLGARQLNSPVTLVLPIPPEVMAAAGGNTALLQVAFFNPSTNSWVTVPCTTAGTVMSCTISNFSLWGFIIRRTPPGQVTATATVPAGGTATVPSGGATGTATTPAGGTGTGGAGGAGTGGAGGTTGGGGTTTAGGGGATGTGGAAGLSPTGAGGLGIPGGAISPPRTGTGGIYDANSSSRSPFLAVALAVIALGAAGGLGARSYLKRQ